MANLATDVVADADTGNDQGTDAQADCDKTDPSITIILATQRANRVADRSHHWVVFVVSGMAGRIDAVRVIPVRMLLPPERKRGPDKRLESSA
jgi:hypothetical protein